MGYRVWGVGCGAIGIGHVVYWNLPAVSWCTGGIGLVRDKGIKGIEKDQCRMCLSV